MKSEMHRLNVQYFWGTRTTNKQVAKVIKDLLKIVEMMTCLTLDDERRVRAAKRLLKDLEE